MPESRVIVSQDDLHRWGAALAGALDSVLPLSFDTDKRWQGEGLLKRAVPTFALHVPPNHFGLKHYCLEAQRHLYQEVARQLEAHGAALAAPMYKEPSQKGKILDNDEEPTRIIQPLYPTMLEEAARVTAFKAVHDSLALMLEQTSDMRMCLGEVLGAELRSFTDTDGQTTPYILQFRPDTKYIVGELGVPTEKGKAQLALLEALKEAQAVTSERLGDAHFYVIGLKDKERLHAILQERQVVPESSLHAR